MVHEERKKGKKDTRHTNMHGLSRRVINLLACRFGGFAASSFMYPYVICMSIRSDRGSTLNCVF